MKDGMEADTSSPSPPPISVVIRAKNEAALIGRTLAAVRGQSLAPAEIVLVDSGSTDGTIEIAREHGVRLVELDPARFSYGRALNVGTEAARHPWVVYLSAHAVPTDAHWLRELTAPLADDRVVAAFGRQEAHPGANPLDARELRRAYGLVPLRFVTDPRFSNANAAVKRDAVIATPFDETLDYAEDVHWARKQCAAGRTVVYAPGGSVLHSHDESFRQILNRQRREVRTQVRHLGLETAVANAWVVPIAIVGGVTRDLVRLVATREHPRWWIAAPGYRTAKVLGTWLGCRDARDAERTPPPATSPSSTVRTPRSVR